MLSSTNFQMAFAGHYGSTRDNAQAMIRAATDQHLWSETYDSEPNFDGVGAENVKAR